MRISDWSSDVCSSDLDKIGISPRVSGRDAPEPGARCPREADPRGNGIEDGGADSASADDVAPAPVSKAGSDEAHCAQAAIVRSADDDMVVQDDAEPSRHIGDVAGDRDEIGRAN